MVRLTIASICCWGYSGGAVDVAVVTVTDTEVFAGLVAVERTVALAVLDTVVLAVVLADELTEEDTDLVAVVEAVDVLGGYCPASAEGSTEHAYVDEFELASSLQKLKLFTTICLFEYIAVWGVWHSIVIRGACGNSGAFCWSHAGDSGRCGS